METHRARAAAMILALILTVFPYHALAANVLSADISEKDWTWTPGGIATFEGTIVYEGSASDSPLTLSLAISCTPDTPDPGSIVFSSVNDQKLSRMKQKSEYVIKKDDNPVFRFTGNWILPDGTAMSGAKVTLTVLDMSGHKVGEASFDTNDGIGQESYTPRFTFPDLKRGITLLLIIAGVICTAAVIRVIYYKRRGESK